MIDKAGIETTQERVSHINVIKISVEKKKTKLYSETGSFKVKRLISSSF